MLAVYMNENLFLHRRIHMRVDTRLLEICPVGILADRVKNQNLMHIGVYISCTHTNTVNVSRGNSKQKNAESSLVSVR